MPELKAFTAAILASGALLAAAAFAQGSGRWTMGAPMPSARTEVAVAELGGKIYVVGGFGGERELEIYDPSADRWSRGAAIPRALHHAAAVGWQNKLYVVGGFVEDWTPTDEVHEYDPANDRWRRLAALPTSRGALAAAVLDGKIHAVGGVGGTAATRRRTRPTILPSTGGRRWKMSRRRATTWRSPRLTDASTPWAAVSTATIRAIWRRTRRTIPQPVGGSSVRRCLRCAAASRQWCSRGGCSCSVARRPPAPSIRRKLTMPGATAGATMRACRRHDTALAQWRSRARFTSSPAARRPAPRRRWPMRFSCREASRACLPAIRADGICTDPTINLDTRGCGWGATNNRATILRAAERHRIPAVYPFRCWATDGGLAVYGVDLMRQYRRAATYVDRILRGANPADLPVQAPDKSELVINLKAARSIGIEITPLLLARADEVKLKRREFMALLGGGGRMAARGACATSGQGATAWCSIAWQPTTGRRFSPTRAVRSKANRTGLEAGFEYRC